MQTMLINGCAILVFGVSLLLPDGCESFGLSVDACERIHSSSASTVAMAVASLLYLHTKFNSLCCIYWAWMNEAATTQYCRNASHMECSLVSAVSGKYIKILSVEWSGWTNSRKWKIWIYVFVGVVSANDRKTDESFRNRSCKIDGFPNVRESLDRLLPHLLLNSSPETP